MKRHIERDMERERHGETDRERHGETDIERGIERHERDRETRLVTVAISLEVWQITQKGPRMSKE